MLDPKENFKHMQERTLDAIASHFPMKGRVQTVHLDRLEVNDNLAHDNIREQHKAKINGTSFAVPVYAHLRLVDNATGKVIDSKKIRVAELPKMTNRYSFIVEGREHQVDNQWQLKAGVYARRRQNGELEAQFNVANKIPFDVVLNPETKQMHMEYGKAKLPVYPLLKTLGVTDDDIEQHLGKDVLESNKQARGVEGTLQKFYKADRKVDPKSLEEAAQHFVKTMDQSKMHADVNSMTLGKPLDNVTGETLLLAGKKLLKVQSGHPEDDRDSLVFKSLRNIADFTHEYIKGAKKVIQSKVDRHINKATDLREIIHFDLMNKPIRTTFIDNAAARFATQINPVEMIGGAAQTTIMGPGGIKSEQAIVDEAKFVNPSHLGFLDAVVTPEGGRTGVSLRLPIGLRKTGNNFEIPVYNLKTQQNEYVGPAKFLQSNVVMPDQVTWEEGRPKPVAKDVYIAGEGNTPKLAKFEEAHYVLKHPSQLYSTTTNLIPFMNNTSGNRASMAARHMEQSISLVQREPPLVQVGTGMKGELHSFESTMGKDVAHVSPVNGVVKHVKHDGIHVEDINGKVHEVQLYNHYPLNDSKSSLNSTPIVKVGDTVKSGQVVADTNFSKDGVLAMGKNLRVAFLPFKGLNFEDGIVLSESAARKLASEHLHKHDIPLTTDTVLNKNRFLIQHPQVFSKDQLEHIDEHGLPKLGSKVKPGDPLLLAMKPFEIKDRTGAMAYRKSLMGAHNDNSVKWDGETEGEVVAIHKNKDGIQVHVRTIEPMQVGDKMCFDADTEVLTSSGWVPVSAISLTSYVCCLVNGKICYQQPMQLHQYPSGGLMYTADNQALSLRVTDNHNLYVAPKDTEEFQLVPASKVCGMEMKHLKIGTWHGVHVPTMELDGPNVPDIVLNTSLFLALVGMKIHTGFINQSGVRDISTVDLILPHTQLLEGLIKELNSAGLEYVIIGDRIRIQCPQLVSYFKYRSLGWDAYIPEDLFHLTPVQLQHFLKYILNEPDLNGLYLYKEVSHRLGDDLQRLCLHAGYCADLKYEENKVFVVIDTTVKHVVVQLSEEKFISHYPDPVYCVTVPGHVLYVRRRGKAVWSGNSGRHGNKGIISKLVPDHEMPHTKDGKPIEVALNSSGIPSRMNVGQVLETAASKIAEKTGKPYVVQNFQYGKDAVAEMQKELAHHGLSDTEELIDPVSGKSIGSTMVGKQYMLKLVHQVDKKGAVSSGMTLPGQPGEGYDLNLQPKTGQRYGSLGMYALLAHGALATIREAQTIKGEGPDPNTNDAKKWPSQHHQVWAAIQTGAPIPMPKPTFAFKKFEDLLRGAGINMEKQGHHMVLSPLTQQHIDKLTEGRVLTRPAELLEAKVDKASGELKPRKGGLFDEKLTGGHGGKLWTAIPLAEPMPNPVFEAPIRALTGLKEKEFNDIIEGRLGVNHNGTLTDNPKGALTGGHAIEHLLKKIDVKSELAKAKETLTNIKPADLDKTVKKVKYLRALDELKMAPHEAYVFKSLPVIPPAMRPASLMDDGNIKYADVNSLYKNFALTNDKLKEDAAKQLPSLRNKLRKELYEGLNALTGYGTPYADQDKKGLLHQVAGSSPKSGLFQKVITQKRQDLSMRTTIVPEPAMGLDEVGLPKKHALDLFLPFVVKKVQDMGYAKNPLEAQKFVSQKTPPVYAALQKVMAERPILLKRDPALHKYSIQGFQPKLTEGSAIKLHPLVCGGLNADFDGDSCLGNILCCSINTETGYKESGGAPMPHIGNIISASVIDISTFPRVESSRTVNRRGVEEFDVPDGTYVPASYQGGIRMMPVTKFSIHPNCKEWLVSTERGREIRCSESHSLAVLDPETLEVVKLSPKDAVGYCIPTIRSLVEDSVLTELKGHHPEDASPKANIMPDTIKLTRDIGWMLGVCIGDGWVSTSYRQPKEGVRNQKTPEERKYTSTLNLSYGEGGDDVVTMWKHLVGIASNNPHFTTTHLPHEFEGKPCVSFRATHSSTYFAQWLEGLIGSVAHYKHLPPGFLQYPLEARQGLFCGLIDTDGTVTKVKAKDKNKPQFQTSYTTVSKQLADEVMLLAMSLGIVPSRTEYENRGKPCYLITFSGRCVQDARWMKLQHAHKREVLQEFHLCEDIEYGRNDYVPLPLRIKEEILSHLRAMGATRREKTEENRQAYTLYVILKRANVTTLTRTSLNNLVPLLVSRELSSYLLQWVATVTDASVGWDVITSATESGEKKTMYDLTVPDAWTFAMADGAIVWDTMAAFVPISKEAVQEAHSMKPTNNLISEATGQNMYVPTLESALGIYKLSLPGKKVNQDFKQPGDVLHAVQKGSLKYNDLIQLNGKPTTAGRIALATAVPEAMQEKVLHNVDEKFDKKGLNKLLHTLATEHKQHFDVAVNKLKDLGNTATFGMAEINVLPGSVPHHQKDHTGSNAQIYLPTGSHTLSLQDFRTDTHARDKALAEAQHTIDKVNKQNLPEAEKARRRTEAYIEADKRARQLHEASISGTGSNLYQMHAAGVKPGWDQYKQMVLAPMLVKDSADRIVPTPIIRSYGEGLDVAGYWTQMHGARRGSVMKVQEVQEPGYMSKLLMNSMMDVLVAAPDCGTSKGISMHIGEKDIHDRVLAHDFKSGHVHVPSGTVITPQVVSQIKTQDKNAKLLVRSPLKCEHEKGICQKCMGLSSQGHMHNLGTNVGVMAAQTIGERAVQLTLKSFHTGGAVEQGGGKLLNAFARFEQLTMLPKKIPNAASLAMHTGTVDKIEDTGTGTNIFINGKKHFVGKDSTGNFLHKPLNPEAPWKGIHVGMKVEAGQHLSDPTRTYVNPHDLYKATKSIDTVQNHLTDEIYDLYRDEGIKRRHVETAVKALSNLTRVVHPGDAHDLLHGEFRPLSVIQKRNNELIKQKLQPIEHTPVLKGVNMLPLSLQEDWMAKLQHQKLRPTLAEAAAIHAHSDIHGVHPIPAIAYGAEIGLNESHADKPGLGHLRNVPRHHY